MNLNQDGKQGWELVVGVQKRELTLSIFIIYPQTSQENRRQGRHASSWEEEDAVAKEVKELKGSRIRAVYFGNTHWVVDQSCQAH